MLLKLYLRKLVKKERTYVNLIIQHSTSRYIPSTTRENSAFRKKLLSYRIIRASLSLCSFVSSLINTCYLEAGNAYHLII